MAGSQSADSPQEAAHGRKPGTPVGEAVREWTAALDDSRVCTAPAVLDRYARTTQAHATRPSCVLYPLGKEEVQAIVKIASTHGVVVYPISRGKNWGYGDACAPTDGAAIVDLSRMNRIVEVNTELAYCVIESGVSQGELYAYLEEHKTGLWMDCTGAGPDASLVGNTLDRGFGHTRYGDHFLTCCGMEVVLADGRILDTGFGHYENAKADRLYRYGIGPFLDGLFCQSNFGIVTRIGLWLMPKPEAFNAFYFQAPRFEDLAQLIDRLRPLRMGGILQSAIHIGNDLRVLSASGRYPWEEAGGEVPLPENLRRELGRKTGVQAWQGFGSITGTAAHVRATRKALRKALRGVGTLRFLSDGKLRWADRAVGVLQTFGLGDSLAFKLSVVRPNYALLKGVPSAEPLQGTQWRLRSAGESESRDPLDLDCGLYWVSPVIPMTGEDAMNLLGLVEPIFEGHGFDLIASINLLTERCLVGILNVTFDKSVEGEAQRASACYDALVKALLGAGYPIYRCGPEGMPKIRRDASVFWDVAGAIKRALDPKDVIARGRYLPPSDET